MLTSLSYFLVCIKAKSCCVDFQSGYILNLAEDEFRCPRRWIGELQAITVSLIIPSAHISACDMLSSEGTRLYLMLYTIADPIEPSADPSAVVFLLITKVRQTATTQPISRRNLERPAKTMELIIIWDNAGECKHIISGYLKCIKMNKGTNDEACRKLAKEYLACRMDK